MPAKSSPTNLSADEARRTLRTFTNPTKQKILSSFFKTGPGQYGHGDIFLGVTVPQTRSVAKLFAALSTKETISLLRSAVHEERLLALLVWVDQFRKGTEAQRAKIFRLYLQNSRHINNWDLVDLSAPAIVGGYLSGRDRSILEKMAVSSILWNRRIAIMATFAFIKNDEFADTLHIAGKLLKDDHDLIHKAVGWMLREVGKRNMAVEEEFLKDHYASMPRTMLRYATERFPESKRQRYLKGTIG